MSLPSIEGFLLRSSLLCGQVPGGAPAYRLQLFLAANKHLGSRHHQNDFQRAIETGVARGLWDNHGHRGSGDYLITEQGHRLATGRRPAITPLYSPCPGRNFRAQVAGRVGGTNVDVRTLGRVSTVYLDGKPVKSAKEACRVLASREGVRLKTVDESAVRVLLDYGIDNDFNIEFR